jgi:hypothetical protein
LGVGHGKVVLGGVVDEYAVEHEGGDSKATNPMGAVGVEAPCYEKTKEKEVDEGEGKKED